MLQSLIPTRLSSPSWCFCQLVWPFVIIPCTLPAVLDGPCLCLHMIVKEWLLHHMSHLQRKWLDWSRRMKLVYLLWMFGVVSLWGFLVIRRGTASWTCFLHLHWLARKQHRRPPLGWNLYSWASWWIAHRWVASSSLRCRGTRNHQVRETSKTNQDGPSVWSTLQQPIVCDTVGAEHFELACQAEQRHQGLIGVDEISRSGDAATDRQQPWW
jgi:hypothetical protein